MISSTDQHPTAADQDPAAISVDGVTHRFGNDVVALRNVSLDAAPGEFLTLLGPSGCGKTTLLRIIAGFEQPSSGRILLNGSDVTATPAHRRSVNMVFQRPMLFPNLDVFGNVAFGLRLQRIEQRELRARVLEALELVRLSGYESRRSGELSGGQMQRVALARAIIMRPQVLLLDEPLSALDLRIRLEMEYELRRLHRELGATFIYVTHDQREALALSDGIAVLNEGQVEQLGPPDEIYSRPSSTFTARFVGDANLIPIEVEGADGGRVRVRCADRDFELDTEFDAYGEAWLAVKPNAVRVTTSGDTDGLWTLPGVLEDVAFRGTGFSYRISVPGLDEGIRAEVSGGTPVLSVGQPVRVSWPSTSIRLLTRQVDNPEGDQ
jgi:spermidine/putrescine transport system ATP-binding protein